MQLCEAAAATHFLESQGQAPLAGSKSSSPQKPLTHWRAKDRCHQQGRHPAHHRSHSHPGEPRTGVFRRVKIQLTMEATHTLENQGQALSAGSKFSSPWKPLTNWVSSAGSKSSSPQKPLTSWRAEDRHCQQGQNPAHHRTHSPTREPRTAIISRVEIQLTTEPTHQLESQGQLLSEGSKYSSPQNPLTSWRAKDRHRQQGPNPAHHRSHSLAGEPKMGIVSR